MRQEKTVLTPRIKGKIEITILTDRNASVAYAQFLGFMRDDALYFEATGSAKREQGDPRDQKIAAELALSRALAKMARQMLVDGNGRVQAATGAQQAARKKRQRRNGRPRSVTNGKLLAIEVIRRKYGTDAADRATRRRQHSI